MRMALTCTNINLRTMAPLSQFLSGTFSEAQTKLSSIIEKESFDTYWALKKLDDLVGVVRFRIIVIFNNHGSRKFLQWKLDIQHYDAIIEHVSWELNFQPFGSQGNIDRCEPNCHSTVDAPWLLIKQNHKCFHSGRCQPNNLTHGPTSCVGTTCVYISKRHV